MHTHKNRNCKQLTYLKFPIQTQIFVYIAGSIYATFGCRQRFLPQNVHGVGCALYTEHGNRMYISKANIDLILLFGKFSVGTKYNGPPNNYLLFIYEHRNKMERNIFAGSSLRCVPSMAIKYKCTPYLNCIHFAWMRRADFQPDISTSSHFWGANKKCEENTEQHRKHIQERRSC